MATAADPDSHPVNKGSNHTLLESGVQTITLSRKTSRKFPTARHTAQLERMDPSGVDARSYLLGQVPHCIWHL